MNVSKKRICPNCRAAELQRSQMRGLIERSILRPAGIRAYRCAACDERFLRFGSISRQTEHASSGAGKIQ